MIVALFREQRPLMAAGLISLIFGIVMALLSLVDSTQILGISRWVKPMKFFVSVAIYLWTIAIYLRYLPSFPRFSRIVSWAIIIIFLGEMIAVTGQSMRGTTSHFNVTSPGDGIVFAIMGLLITINTLLAGAILIFYFLTKIELSTTLVWGLRLGLFLFLLASVQGGYMSAQMSHTVGAVDGGAGLPLTNWSTAAGDLRVAHFLGLHSLQAIPIFALTLERFRISNATFYTAEFAALYFAFFLLLFYQALLGRPLISL